ncbi:MAG: nucleoside monophosphate kinase [Acidobacteria bacterium]|nr:nucleoside monophosphate kinase [Acidobacteriota bacterium]
MVILLFGPPGCGKGTQSPHIANLLNIPAISTGEMLRAEVEAGSPLGKAAAGILASGQLVSDDIVSQMLVRRLSEPDCGDGFLLDGYPRTVPQAEFLDAYLRKHGFAPATVLFLTAPDYVLIERIGSRRQCPRCGAIYNILFKPPARPGHCDRDGTALVKRKDDVAEAVKQRLRAYQTQTQLVLEHYRNGDFHTVRADRPPAEVLRDIMVVLEPRMAAVARRRTG